MRVGRGSITDQVVLLVRVACVVEE